MLDTFAPVDPPKGPTDAGHARPFAAEATPPREAVPAQGEACAPEWHPDWSATLRCGDVVLFVFPVSLPHDGEAPKTRPCLVLDVIERGGHRFALLAYGTSAATTANRGYEITVATAAEALAAGLARYTRFVGARRLLVSLDHKDFRPKRGTGSPVIGRLGPEAMARLHAVRARIHAEADMAAERRAEARRERQHRRVPQRPVVVERRPLRAPVRPPALGPSREGRGGRHDRLVLSLPATTRVGDQA